MLRSPSTPQRSEPRLSPAPMPGCLPLTFTRHLRLVLATLLMASLRPAERDAAAFEQARSEYGAPVHQPRNLVRVRLEDRGHDASQALARAMSTLSIAPCSALRLVEAAPGDDADVIVRFYDRAFPFDATVSAHTDVKSHRRTGAIEGAVVQLDGTRTFAAGFCWRHALDLESVLLHELGHAVGFAHSLDPSAVMRAGIKPGQVRRGLSTDDVRGLCVMYPVGESEAARREAAVIPAGRSAGRSASWASWAAWPRLQPAFGPGPGGRRRPRSAGYAVGIPG